MSYSIKCDIDISNNSICLIVFKGGGEKMVQVIASWWRK